MSAGHVGGTRGSDIVASAADVLLRNIYFSFVYQYLIYCVEVWGNVHNTYLDPLMKLQKSVYVLLHFLII